MLLERFEKGEIFGAGEGNRTPVISLEGFCSTIELHPHRSYVELSCDAIFWWRGMDSNHRRRKPTDLQSAPFSHSGTPPLEESRILNDSISFVKSVPG